jgi:hypothetical protein
MNTALILGGPALVQYRGQSFYAKGNIKLTSNKQTFGIEADRYGKVDERVADEELKVSFEPAGEFEALSVLYPYAATLLGSLVTPSSLLVSSINTTNEQLTVTAHGLATGDDVLVHVDTGGSLPTATPALATGTRYWVRNIDVNTVKLYSTSGDAGADTNPINFSAAGTGNFYLDRDWPLVIHTFSGTKLTLHNAAVTKMPAVSLSAVKTLFGTVEFEAFLRNGANWSDANSRYTLAPAALSDTTFDPANIKTQPYSAGWGVTAPWSAFVAKEGFEVEFNLGLEAVTADSIGIVSRRLKGLEVTCKCAPMGISEQDVLAKLLLQDTGAARGRSLSGSNLLISGTGVYVQLYGAALKATELNFSSGLDRLGTLEWVATRTFAAGVPNPLFYVGATTPP